MSFHLACLVFMGIAIATIAEPQNPYYPNYYNPSNNPLLYGGQNFGPHYDFDYIQQGPGSFRAGYPYPSYDLQGKYENPEDRFFFGTATLTLSTTTSTATITTSTTCTTSTGAISTCSPSGRRRRGLNAKSRGLFYTEDEDHFDSIFVRSPEQQPQVAVEEKRQEREAKHEMVPFVIQPGFTAPDGRKGRFLVAFGTKTIATTTTSTYTAILTAKCKSVTSFSSCGTSGK